MSNALVSCGSCHRHVRVADERCPFCGASVVGIEPVRRAVRRGLTRSAILLGTVLGAAACGGGGSSTEPTGDETSGSEEVGDESNESGPGDTTGDDPVETTPEEDPGGPVAMYGAPAPN